MLGIFPGQLVAEYPFIYLMSRFPLTKLVGVTMYVVKRQMSLHVR